MTNEAKLFQVRAFSIRFNSTCIYLLPSTKVQIHNDNGKIHKKKTRLNDKRGQNTENILSPLIIYHELET